MAKLVRALPIAGVAAGILLIASQISALNQYRVYRSWLPFPAVIDSVKVAGKRAFHPEVHLRYVFGDSLYTSISYMNVPGFGSKRNRLDVAERITSALFVGDTLTVYVDPGDPTRAVVQRRLSYATYLILTTGLFFIALGLFFFIRRRRSQSQ